MTKVLIVRGHQATPWELRPWERLPERFDVRYLRTDSNAYDSDGVALPAAQVRSLRDRLPRGALFDVAARAVDRYTGGEVTRAYASADIVHAEELSYWFAADAARRRRAGGRFRLVLTVWETLPMAETFRTLASRRHRAEVLRAVDLYLPATERARIALLLEGVPAEKVEVCPPGIDTARFAGVQVTPTQEHTVVSTGRLVWEKGHQDAIRALALLDRGIVPLPDGVATPRLRIVGNGPERARLEAHARELGVGSHVSFESVAYDEMPRVFASASCLLLGSQASATAGFHPLDVPHAFWEEQFGLVFIEAMASGLPIVTTTSGAIPEVLQDTATLVAAGDYVGMAHALAAGPLSRPPGERAEYPADLVRRYSLDGMAERLAGIYDALTSARR